MAQDKAPSDPLVYTHRDFGAAYFVVNLPNSYERMWMVARAINFDVENYNKIYNNPDRAMKKRYIRNFIRFLDQPLSYVYWHSLPYWRSGTIRFLPLYWAFCFIGTWWVMGSTLYQGAVDRSREAVRAGHKRYETPVEEKSWSHYNAMLFHEHEYSMDKGMVSQKGAPPYPKFCRLNYHVRDQNLRKYFAHRERRGVDPFTGKPKA